jgi:Tfp pilus assembly protein PilF
MSLINDMLRDLQNRRTNLSRTPSSVPGGIRPVARRFGRPGSAGPRWLKMVVLLGVVVLLLVGGGLWSSRHWPMPPWKAWTDRDASFSENMTRRPISREVLPDDPALLAARESRREAQEPGQQAPLQETVEQQEMAPAPSQTMMPDAARQEAGPTPIPSTSASDGSTGNERSPETARKAEDARTEAGGPEVDPHPVQAAKAAPLTSSGSPPDPDISEPEEQALAHEVEMPSAWDRPGLWDENPAPPSIPPSVQVSPPGQFSRTRAQDMTLQEMLDRALNALARGQLRGAEELLRGLLRQDPAHAQGLEALLSILLRQNRTAEAVQLLRQGEQRGPLPPSLGLILARLLAGDGKQEPALEVLKSMPQAHRTPKYQALLGAILQQMGRYEASAAAYQAALSEGSQTGANWAGLGLALEAMGQAEDARAAFAQALKQGIQDQVLARYVARRLNALR